MKERGWVSEKGTQRTIQRTGDNYEMEGIVNRQRYVNAQRDNATTGRSKRSRREPDERQKRAIKR